MARIPQIEMRQSWVLVALKFLPRGLFARIATAANCWLADHFVYMRTGGTGRPWLPLAYWRLPRARGARSAEGN
jgi:hypothetical protein